MAAIDAAIEGLVENDFDAVLTGGVDANMSAATFTKFCKIGALSATGTRPYAEGADGFVMGEGAAVFLLKRLADAERAGDPIYAVIRGLAGSSDGRGKGITAPNPIGQRLAVERAWRNAGVTPNRATMIEGHGTSTRVGDVVEVESLTEVFKHYGFESGSLPLGSVKSNIGHLKGAAGAAGMLKAIYSLHHKVLPPSLGFERPNPNIDFEDSPFYVNDELRPWETDGKELRRAGVSAFGFGGTNFHVVLEEYVPGRSGDNGRTRVTVGEVSEQGPSQSRMARPPLRGIALLGADSESALKGRLDEMQISAAAGKASEVAAPAAGDLNAPTRLAIDYGDADELSTKAGRAAAALEGDRVAAWTALAAQGVFAGSGNPEKVAFLYTGQGSQYVNMLRDLAAAEPIVAEVFEEADAVMKPLLGRPLSDLIFVDEDDESAVAGAASVLRQTAITQPAVLAVDVALTRLLAAYGIEPDMVMGHSLGEYAALVAAGALPFDQALTAVSARGNEMTRVSVEDCGTMAAIFAPLEEIEQTIASIDGYVVVANINSTRQAVIGGASAAVNEAVEIMRTAGNEVRPLPVSHAFHTEIVAPAAAPLRRTLERLDLAPPKVPIVANVSGGFYPSTPGCVPEMIDLLGSQIASPVQFVKGLETLYSAGARVFVEVGPKRALHGFVVDVLGERSDVVAMSTNHPRVGGVKAFNYALSGLYATGHGTPAKQEIQPETGPREVRVQETLEPPVVPYIPPSMPSPVASPADGGRFREFGELIAQVLEKGFEIYSQGAPAAAEHPVVVSGAAIGLPGTERVFDDANVGRILAGDQFITSIPADLREGMLSKNVTRLVKSEQGEPRFESIDNVADVIKLAARHRKLDLHEEFGYPEDRLAALDITSQLAIGAGLDALRDAGLPLVLHYRTTSKGTQLPDRWMLPESLRDETGVIFASAFPGTNAFADENRRYYQHQARCERLAELEELRSKVPTTDGALAADLDRRLDALRVELDRDGYTFDRRFLFRILAMGHSQFAELIGARGPNTQVNSACASGTQAVSIAEDWIRQGRCRRVVIVSADDVTSDHLMEWIGAGFLASGAAATDERVEDAAIPFDRRRHGMLIGMGAAAIVIESADATAERGLRPITEVLATETANSAYHGTRLNIDHICDVMEKLVSEAERKWGIDRRQIAGETVFLSHETYTPARGGSAQAEVHALRRVFGDAADKIVVANTKGMTGHPMGVGIEDVVAIKALETGIVPPVANFREVDPELGRLNLSRGGSYPIRYALRLGAGFGSQISLSLMRWVPTADGRRPTPDELGHTYRIDNPAVWQNWLVAVGGSGAETEIQHRTLRVRDSKMAAIRQPARQPVHTQTESPVTTEAQTPALPVATPPAPHTSEISDPIQVKVLEIVADKTGYPPEMLDLDLDLEADLGIDTVKQAETFAAIREAWDIPRDDNLALRDYPTLAHAVEFVYTKRPDLRRPSEAPPAVVAAEAMPPSPPESISSQAMAVATPDRATDPVQQKVLEIVADKTGYPPEMLDLDLDLEADLGIDTVKQAETFAAIREAWDIPRDDELALRDYPTLAHAVEFVYTKRPDLRGTEDLTSPEADPEQVAETLTAPPTSVAAESQSSIARRVPIPVLRPSLSLCSETGVTLDTSSRVIVRADDGGVAKALRARLEKLGAEVLMLEGSQPDAVEKLLKDWLDAGPIQGVYWLPALDGHTNLSQMTDQEWGSAITSRLGLLYTTMRTLYDSINAPGAFLVAATRLGGLHGYDSKGAWAPLGGAVSGFTKTFKRERPDALVKVVDFAPSRKTAQIADRLIAETLHDPGAVEIGYWQDERWAIVLGEQEITDPGEGITLDSDSVFLVTGAAGSIVSAIVTDLALASGGTFHLLDIAPEPDRNNPDLQRFVDDREALKLELFERMRAKGERATPAAIESQLAALERQQAAVAAIEAVEQAGGEAIYHSVDLLDPDAVESVVAQLKDRHDRLDVLIHAAGLEISHVLPNKEPIEFDRVFDVKAKGWFHLLRALGDLPLGATVAFSSIAGRFGNAGQTDYASANDLLCKLCSALRSERPETRGIAIDWTAWGEIGMATRGSIPKMMELAGIDMLAPEAGIPVVRRELTSGAGGGEIVVAGNLGGLLEEWHHTGGLDLVAVSNLAGGLLTGTIRNMGLYSGLSVETRLDPTEQPFLYDHQIDNTPVLPGVMGVEAFAEAAALLFPDRHLAAVEDVRFLAPFKFYRNEPRSVTVQANFRLEGDEVVADCCLLGSRHLPSSPEPVVTEHFKAKVRLSQAPPDAMELAWPEDGSTEQVGVENIYQIYFHGPAYQVVERAWAQNGEALGLMPESLPLDHAPAELTTITSPRLLELCFQTAGLWELGRTGRLGLPATIDRVSWLKRPGSTDQRLCAIVRQGDDEGSFDARVVDQTGAVHVVLEGYRTIDLPTPIDATELANLKVAMR
jgi:acyl transferase domain-containing protein/NAD(P)-dependent dehydrogenase (short-subunit alcohol dehydrogenase family)/acyl carrier protein